MGFLSAYRNPTPRRRGTTLSQLWHRTISHWYTGQVPSAAVPADTAESSHQARGEDTPIIFNTLALLSDEKKTLTHNIGDKHSCSQWRKRVKTSPQNEKRGHFRSNSRRTVTLGRARPSEIARGSDPAGVTETVINRTTPRVPPEERQTASRQLRKGGDPKEDKP